MILLSITNTEAIILSLVIVVPILLFVFYYFSYQKSVKKIEDTQDKLSDRELILKFAEEPDGYMTVERLMKKSNLTKQEARFRLQYFQFNGVLSTSFNSKSFKSYYQLIEPIEQKEVPTLSNKPYLTVEDLLSLVKAFDYRITLQNLCIATGLPISIIKRELKYFQKENILETVTFSNHTNGQTRTTYLLKEPYRSRPDEFLELESKMNIELEKIYQSEFKDEDLV